MAKRRGVLVALLGLGVLGCGGSDSSGSSMNSSGSTKSNHKTVQRESFADNRFKPVALENTIDELVLNFEDANVSDDLALGVVLKELTGFWRPVSIGANRALSELEVVGSVQGSTEDNLTVAEKAAEQIGFVKEQAALDYDGLAIAPHNDDLLPYVQKWVDKGKQVITIDGDLPTSGRDIYIGTDNKQGGTTGGQTLVDLLAGETGRVIVLGNTDPSWADGFVRTNKAAKVIEDAGNEVQILNSLWSEDDEVAQIVDAMTSDASDKPVVGMIGVFANAYALGTAALEVAPDTMPTIVAFDFEPQTLDYMQQGVIAATHVQRQYYMGYLSVYLLYSINAIGLKQTKATISEHLVDGHHLDTGLDVIRAKDLDEYNAFVDELGI